MGKGNLVYLVLEKNELLYNLKLIKIFDTNKNLSAHLISSFSRVFLAAAAIHNTKRKKKEKKHMFRTIIRLYLFSNKIFIVEKL